MCSLLFKGGLGVDLFHPSSPSFPKRGLGEISIPLASPFGKGRNYF